MGDTRVVYLEPGQIKLETITLPQLKSNQVLVKTHQASVCGSERYFYRGITVRPEDEARGGPESVLGGDKGSEHDDHSYPMGPLGHEGGGTIVEVGSAVSKYLGGGAVSAGDRVGSLIYPTYSDYWVTDIDHIQPIPDGVSVEVGCLYEPLGCAVWAALHMGVTLGDIVVVNGVGFAGNIMLQGAVKSGASQVIAVDVEPHKLEIAKALGATHTINAAQVDPVVAVNELTRGEGADVVFECAGFLPALPEGLGYLRQSGTFVEMGHFVDVGTLDFNPNRLLMRKNLRLEAVWASHPEHFIRAMPILEKNEFPVADMVSHTIPVDRVAEGFNALSGGYHLDGQDAIKIAVKGGA